MVNTYLLDKDELTVLEKTKQSTDLVIIADKCLRSLNQLEKIIDKVELIEPNLNERLILYITPINFVDHNEFNNWEYKGNRKYNSAKENMTGIIPKYKIYCTKEAIKEKNERTIYFLKTIDKALKDKEARDQHFNG